MGLREGLGPYRSSTFRTEQESPAPWAEEAPTLCKEKEPLHTPHLLRESDEKNGAAEVRPRRLPTHRKLRQQDDVSGQLLYLLGLGVPHSLALEPLDTSRNAQPGW